MTDAKTHKREVRAVWNAVRRDRRERSRLTSAADLTDSAQRLEAHAAALKALAQSVPSSDTPQSKDPKPTRPAATKDEPKRKSSSTKKAKKTKKK